ncbi:MAG: hypothetical protein JSV30_06165 [Candidatus Omnitrophota bacterium]|nr:MAG: hypothetical protein JSV30_06165 [Candidatus Omnitrophota bacterium]
MRRLNKRGQNTIEYAVLVAVVVSALLAIQTYLNRGVKGRLRSSVDSIGQQYSAGNMTSSSTTTVAPQKNEEEFGTDTLGRGYTKSKSTGGTTTVQTTGEGEKTTLGLSEETLWEGQ